MSTGKVPKQDSCMKRKKKEEKKHTKRTHTQNSFTETASVPDDWPATRTYGDVSSLGPCVDEVKA